MYEASLSCSPTQQENILPQHHMGIVYSGATHFYISLSAPHGHPDTKATPITLGMANGQMVKSRATATLPIPQLAADFQTTGYIMSSFTNTLIGVGTICDTEFKVLFTKKDVVVISPEGKTILTGWKDNIMYEASLSCSPTQQENILPQHHMGIVYSGATHLYISLSAPHGHPDTKATPITVGTVNGKMVKSAAKATLPIPQLAAEFPTTGYIMPSFNNTLIGAGPICDADCKVLLTKKDVVVILTEGKTF